VGAGDWAGNGEPVDASGLIQSEERENADGVRLMTIEKARGLLDEARQLGSGDKGAQCAAVLPAALVEPYLKALEKQDDWLRETADIAPLSRVWRLWWAKQSARI
jgi:phytoene synthase